MVHIDQHLMFEHEALDILMAQANAWHRLERSTTPTSSDLHQANDATRRAVQQMSDLRARAATACELTNVVIVADFQLISYRYLGSCVRFPI